ncbi:MULTISPECIES: hypothetical protein [Streptomyces]|uniref:Uncharacterized protein n=1 Tax=Streptomyces dengpaensis TaxID=2049881 RepID=A0ABM6T3L6_9ACTN|nr:MULTISPECIES: hypothetical protein [Streptomyces]AVH61708.1 hypothetical protein C4B68_40040 [Streptomyces dengpaensis]PIB05084.1 hypothetical protein B1C81_30755 [Streptomyces sp. HG99]
MTAYTIQAFPNNATHNDMQDVREVFCDVGLEEFGSPVLAGRLDLDPLFYRGGLTEVSLCLDPHGLRHLGYVTSGPQAVQLLQQAVEQDIDSGAFATCVGYRHAALQRKRHTPAR